jgi:hypothetical protein
MKSDGDRPGKVTELLVIPLSITAVFILPRSARRFKRALSRNCS